MQVETSEYIRRLEAKVKQQEEYIAHLEQLSEAYDHLGDLTHTELVQADKTIRAYESLGEHSRSERMGDAETIQAREMMSSLAEIEIMHKDLTLRMVLEINRNISSILDRNVLLDQILETLVQMIAAHRGILFVNENGGLKPVIFRRIDNAEIETDYFRPLLAIAGKTAAEMKSSLEQLEVVKDGKPTKIAVICVPMICEKKLTGVLYADTVTETNIFRTSDLEVAEIFASQAAIAMENASLYSNLEQKVSERTKELNDALSIIKSDLALAQDIQQRVLPKNLEDITELRFDIRYIPISDIGGDIYDVARLADGRVRVFVADATGHGVQAALVTMLIKAEYEALKNVAPDPAALLVQLNRKFYRDYRSLTVFFTCVVADIHPSRRRLEFASAGHPGQFLIGGGSIELLSSTGKLAGAIEDSAYTNRSLDFGPDSRLLLFTDGLFEEFDKDNVEYGEERAVETLRAFLAQTPGANVQACAGHLLENVRAYMDGVNRNDDITVVGVEFAGPDSIPRTAGIPVSIVKPIVKKKPSGK